MSPFCKFALFPWMVSALMLICIVISISIPIIILVDCKYDNAKEYIEIERLSPRENIITSSENMSLFSSNYNRGNMSLFSSNYNRGNMRVSSSNNRENMKNPSNYDNGLMKTQADFLEWVRYVASKKHENGYDTEDGNGSDRNGSSRIITVSKTNKEAHFSSVQAAVNSIPYHNMQRLTIQIDAGVYTEKVEVPASKPYITFQGAGTETTVITWHDTASSSGSTFKSSSVAINSKYFIARDLSFKNSAPAPPPGATGKQAVALRISADKAAFYNCKFYGAQDTLYDQAGRHYFQSCFIEGSIDFIFGDGLSLYERCQLHSIATKFGSLTAQHRQKPSDNTGFSFLNCKVTGSGMIYLGRAWGSYSRVVFITCYIDDIIIPTGWDDWGISKNQKTAFFGEYNCLGPGSKSKSRVAWSYQLTPTQASPFQSLSFVDGSSWVQS